MEKGLVDGAFLISWGRDFFCLGRKTALAEGKKLLW